MNDTVKCITAKNTSSYVFNCNLTAEVNNALTMFRCGQPKN